MGDPACHMRFCHGCDYQVSPDAEECPDCGAELETLKDGKHEA